ncbi:hypothetical protein THAPSDRAFT_262636, partial [Thalassiosira pseudonana CCMP1335]
CIDTNEGCEKWALDGECDINLAYMLEECKRSCKVCTNAEHSINDCRNQHSQCSQWAIGEGCNANTAYMKQKCAPACQSC